EPDQFARGCDLDALELCDPASAPEPAALQEAALRLESAALAVNGVSQVQSASAAYGRRAMWIATSNGFSAGYERSSHGLSGVAITGEGLA
ncbi:hypothetical protein, partial [Streptomyces sp. P17]|uniref:hypothetical protein n=1 Tax=Streptomyces sp. P17 TaxID=3074716 RepID=UPI0028F4488C